VDAGPHPNLAHARWGRRAHRLEPDPCTAPWVRWIFEQRATRRSVAGIARELNERGVPCPSGADPARNSHRSGAGWIVRTVVAILENPRYTGRQVWNRQRADRDRGDHRDRHAVQRWNPPDKWVVSERLAHPPLVTDEVFLAVQGLRAARPSKDGTARSYAFAGLLVCGLCRRRMDSHWAHGRPGYRCRHGHTSAQRRPPGLGRSIYIREDVLVDRLHFCLDCPPRTDHAALARILHARGQSIIYDGGSIRLEPAASWGKRVSETILHANHNALAGLTTAVRRASLR